MQGDFQLFVTCLWHGQCQFRKGPGAIHKAEYLPLHRVEGGRSVMLVGDAILLRCLGTGKG